MLRRLNHPNIIKPHGEGGRFEFRPTLEMEDGGGTLAQYIHGGAVMGNNGNIALLSGVVVSTRGRFEYEPEYGPEYDPESVPSAPKAIIHQYGGAVSTQDSKSCMTQILSALEYLRENNIVHRDIKPQNILINPGNGHVKLADFGEAEHVKAHRTLKTAAGTPGYMAPEVMEVYLATANAGNGCGVESDMFSAGCMFYELLTGTKYLQTKGSDITIVLQRELNMVKERNVQQWMKEKAEAQLFKVEPHNQEHVIALLTGMLEPDPHKRLTPVQAQAILAKITPEPPLS